MNKIWSIQHSSRVDDAESVRDASTAVVGACPCLASGYMPARVCAFIRSFPVNKSHGALQTFSLARTLTNTHFISSVFFERALIALTKQTLGKREGTLGERKWKWKGTLSRRDGESHRNCWGREMRDLTYCIGYYTVEICSHSKCGRYTCTERNIQSGYVCRGDRYGGNSISAFKKSCRHPGFMKAEYTLGVSFSISFTNMIVELNPLGEREIERELQSKTHKYHRFGCS